MQAACRVLIGLAVFTFTAKDIFAQRTDSLSSIRFSDVQKENKFFYILPITLIGSGSIAMPDRDGDEFFLSSLWK